MANPPPLYKFHLLLFIIFLQYLLCLHYLTSCFRRYILHDHFITQTMPAPASNYSLGSSFTPGIHLIRFPCHIFYLSTQNSPFPISLFSISIIYPCQKKAKVFHSRIFLLLLLLFLPRANKFGLLWYIFTERDAGKEDVPPLAASVPEC